VSVTIKPVNYAIIICSLWRLWCIILCSMVKMQSIPVSYACCKISLLTYKIGPTGSVYLRPSFSVSDSLRIFMP